MEGFDMVQDTAFGPFCYQRQFLIKEVGYFHTFLDTT